MEQEKVVLSLLEAEALKAGEVAEKSGIDKKEVDKIIKKLVKEEKVYSPKRCFYQAKQ